MIFSIIILALVAGIAYYHYVQGMFTAAISAFCAFIATMVAFGYYEQLVGAIGAGKMADSAAGMLLIVLFTATYLLLRMVIDSAVPGNILVPLYVEKVGAGAFGVVAGVLTVGVFATGAQLMPLGPSVAGYERFPTESRLQVSIPRALLGTSVQRDAVGNVYGELKENELNPANAQGLMIPVDDMVVSLASMASENSLRGVSSLPEVHPNLLNEAFANRLGADLSGRRVIINTPGLVLAKVLGIYEVPGNVTALDAEPTALRPNQAALTYKDAGGLVVLRTEFNSAAADSDGMVRITPAQVRLVIDGQEFRPVGTMAGPTRLALHRLDDQLIISTATGGKQADLAFSLPQNLADRLTKAPAKGGASDGSAFVDFKLMGRFDLSLPDRPGAYPGPTPEHGVLRKAATPLSGEAPKPR